MTSFVFFKMKMEIIGICDHAIRKLREKYVEIII